MNPLKHLAGAFSKSLLITGMVGLVFFVSGCGEKEQKPKSKGPKKSAGAAFPGYNLVQQLGSRTTDLVDLEGRVVHQWKGSTVLGGGAELLPNGDLVRSGSSQGNTTFGRLPGLTGVIEWCDWDGNVKWSYNYGDATKILHHDLHVLDNGNLLVIGVEDISKEREVALGRDPKRAQKNLWLDFVIEFKPKGKDQAEVVWEWHLVDHLIQEFDKTKSNFGVVTDHPELLDINAIENLKVMSSAMVKTMQGLGYIGTSGPAQPQSALPEWTHMNSVTYHPKLDQILVSVPNIGEIWIIDHSVNTKEAAGHAGGKYGKGGDFLYRWGNPQIYQRGLPKEQALFGQHDAMWIPEGLPGAGNITMFNNGEGRPGNENYSTVVEITPPLKKDGTYELAEGQAWGPAKPAWTYTAEKKTDFYSPYISSAQRLPNGNTLICSGVQGRLFEVTAEGDIVWEEDREVNFMGPGGSGPGGNRGGGQGPGGPPGLGGGPGGPGGGPGGPGGPGGGRQRGRPGAGIAMSALSFAVGGSGQVGVFGTFEFFKALSTLGGGQRGPGGPQGGPPGGGGPGGFAGGPQGQGGPPGMPPGGPQGGPPGGPQQGGPGMRQGGPGGPGGPQGGGPGQGQRQRPPGGQGGPGGQAPRMAGGPGGGPGGPNGRPGGPGGPGNGPGGGKATKSGGGLFRTIRYGLDYPAFVGRKLDPIPEDQLMAGGSPQQGGGPGGPPNMPQFGPGNGPGGPGIMPPGGPGGPSGPPGNFDPSNPPPFPPPGGSTEGMLPPPPNAPYPPDFRRPPNAPASGSSGGAQPPPPPNGQPPYPPSAPGGNNGPQAK